MEDKFTLACLCIICLTAIGVACIATKIDGTILTIIISAITGVFGACIGLKLAVPRTKDG